MSNSSLDNVTSGHYLRSAYLDYLMCTQVSIRVTESDNNTDSQTLLEMIGGDASWILKGPIPSILVYTINQKPMIPRSHFHMGCTLFWVKFGHAFAYFVVLVY